MKLTKIRVLGPTQVDFPLTYEDEDNPFLLKGADGLGPVAVDVLRNGERRPQSREIVLLIGLEPSYADGETPESLRKMLYDLLTPRYNSLIELQFMENETVHAFVEGQVKNMEISLFTADPEVQVTISCVGKTSSYLLAPAEISSTPAIPPFTDGYTTVEVDNIGDAPSGFRIGLEFTQAVYYSPLSSTLVGLIIDDGALGGQRMTINRAFSVGQRLVVDTRVGSRGLWYALAGTTNLIPIINDLSLSSDWMTFHRGLNQLMINAQFSWYSGGIKHTPAYWGV